MKREIHKSTVLVGNLDTPPLTTDRTGQNISKENLTTPVTKRIKLTFMEHFTHDSKLHFLLSTHGIITKIDHILCHISILNKFIRIKTRVCGLTKGNQTNRNNRKRVMFKHLETK